MALVHTVCLAPQPVLQVLELVLISQGLLLLLLLPPLPQLLLRGRLRARWARADVGVRYRSVCAKRGAVQAGRQMRGSQKWRQGGLRRGVYRRSVQLVMVAFLYLQLGERPLQVLSLTGWRE